MMMMMLKMLMMMCRSRLLLAAWMMVTAALLELGSCKATYVTLIGTDPSTPPMKCEEKKFTHVKPDGEALDVEHLSGEDGVLKIEKDDDEEGKYSLVIKLTEEAANNNYLFIGEWKCKDQTWTVKGEPYIERLSLDWEKERHRLSATVNEGSAVALSCHAFVIAEVGETPEFTWSIEREEGVTDGSLGDEKRWEKGGPIEIKENHWRSNYTLVATDGVSKEDRSSYRCTVSVGSDPKMERSHAMLLRVKGKLAALWPAIGILIEVVLLGVGTWLYEKRKSKTDSAATEAKDADSSASGVAQPSSSTGAVRKRNTVNT